MTTCFFNLGNDGHNDFFVACKDDGVCLYRTSCIYGFPKEITLLAVSWESCDEIGIQDAYARIRDAVGKAGVDAAMSEWRISR